MACVVTGISALFFGTNFPSNQMNFEIDFTRTSGVEYNLIYFELYPSLGNFIPAILIVLSSDEENFSTTFQFSLIISAT